MSALLTATPPLLPTHMDLPDTDGKPVDNTYQPVQWAIFLDSIEAHMKELRPDGQFLAAADHGIYFKSTKDPLEGCRAPDFMIVEGVPPRPSDYWKRRSYVLWQDLIAPTLVVELVSGDGTEEHDRTPSQGKFWIYENAIHAGYYCIYDPENEQIELFELANRRYRKVAPNQRGRYPIPDLQLELGTVPPSEIGGVVAPWLRFFDAEGNLLLTGAERAEREKASADAQRKRADEAELRADEQTKRAEEAEKRAERLAQKLRELGIDLNGN